MFKKLLIVLLSMVLIAIVLPFKTIAQDWVSFNKSIIPEKPTAVVLKSDDFETIIKFTIPGIEVENIIEGTETFQSLRFPDYFTTLEIGKPQLPAISEFVGIPPSSNVRVSVIDSTVITLEEKYNVYPFQEPVIEGEIKPFFINREFYKKDLFFPDNI